MYTPIKSVFCWYNIHLYQVDNIEIVHQTSKMTAIFCGWWRYTLHFSSHLKKTVHCQLFFPYRPPTASHPDGLPHWKFNSSPLKNGGWKTTFLLGRYFQGWAVKLSGGYKKIGSSHPLENFRNQKLRVYLWCVSVSFISTCIKRFLVGSKQYHFLW